MSKEFKKVQRISLCMDFREMDDVVHAADDVRTSNCDRITKMCSLTANVGVNLSQC